MSKIKEILRIIKSYSKIPAIVVDLHTRVCDLEYKVARIESMLRYWSEDDGK